MDAPNRNPFWEHPSQSPSEGVSSNQVEPMITYPIMNARDTMDPKEQNYAQGEPIFAVKNASTEGIEKTYSLAQINHELDKQHEVLLNISAVSEAGKRKRDAGSYIVADFITEDNFEEKLVFLGFVADTSHNSQGNSTSANPGNPVGLLTLHARGKLDQAYLWGGGSRRVACQVGDHVGFTVKRMNSVDMICDLDQETVGLHGLLSAIGPLQVKPIAARRKHTFLSHTIKHRTVSTYIGESKGRATTGMPCINYTIDTPTEELLILRRSSHRRLDRLNYTTLDQTYGGLVDDYGVDAYCRGTSFATITNLIPLVLGLCRDEGAHIRVKSGNVIETGYIMDVHTGVPPNDMIQRATSFSNGYLNRYTPSSRSDPDFGDTYERPRSDDINLAHARLQDDYGIHLFVHLTCSPFMLDVDAISKMHEKQWYNFKQNT